MIYYLSGVNQYLNFTEDSLCLIPNQRHQSIDCRPLEDPDAIICNDEGKLRGLPWNRPLLDEDGQIYDVIAGTFLVLGLTEDDFGSLTEEQIKRYTELFQWIR